MNIETYRNFCLSLPNTTEDFPFGPDTIVFKTNGKIFTLAGIELFESINLKADPEEAIEQREQYPSVLPGYHMNKKHWNTILMDNSIPDKLIKEWIKKSYELVNTKPPRKK